jgi:K+/H+ antiporter YhaU regulatory subunit KhtT
MPALVLITPSGWITLAVLLPSGSELAGSTLRDLRFRQRFNATVLALKRANTTLQDRSASCPSGPAICC